MAGKRKAEEPAGGVAKKRAVVRPCRLCPDDAKRQSYYGQLDETTKGGWLYKCCTPCYHQLKNKGEDVSNEAAKLKNGATPLPTFPPNTCRCRGQQQHQGAQGMPSDVLRFT